MSKSLLYNLLKFFATRIIRKYHPDVVGITGSIGKTSTKEAIAAVLACKFSVRSSHKNYNNEVGLPLAIIGVEKTPERDLIGWARVFFKAASLLIGRDADYPEVLVLEMGADKPGDIEYLTKIAPCKVGVLTYISHAHTAVFKTIKKIAQEKRVIIAQLQRDGFAVLNYDNEIVMQNVSATRAEVVTYGLKEGADLRASDVNILTDTSTGWPNGLNFKVNFQGSSIPAFLPGQVAEHLIPSALAGLAVGSIFGVNLVEGIEAMKKMPPLPGHMRLLPGIKNTLLIDDSYNSSPEPTKSALKTLAKITSLPGSRRYAVLGDMLELGTETEDAHREIGLKVAELGIDFLITVGEASKHSARAAREAGLNDDQVACFADSVSAGKFLQEKMAAGDIILIKGSQSMRMEKIVKEVMAEPMKAQELLARQDGSWLKS